MRDLSEKAKELKEQVPIENYFYNLVSKGILSFDKKIGSELYFNHGKQRTGSVSVNPSKNTWYDHLNGKGGDIFTGAQYFENKDSFYNAYRHIQSQFSTISNIDKTIYPTVNKSKHSSNLKNYEILKILDKIKSPALLAYLHSRGFKSKEVEGVLKELHWKNDKGKEYYALAFENEKGGFAIRNKAFKSQLGPLHPKLIKVNGENNTEIKLFEGVYDFISYKAIKPEAKYDAYILNSLSNLMQFENIKENYTKTSVYFDNNKAGKEATEKIKNGEIKDGVVKLTPTKNVHDYSNVYSKHEDLNDFYKSLVFEKPNNYELNTSLGR